MKQACITELIEPMMEQVNEIKSQKGNKEAKMREAQANVERLKKEKEMIEKQLESIKND